jgi:hypothetical protein
MWTAPPVLLIMVSVEHGPEDGEESQPTLELLVGAVVLGHATAQQTLALVEFQADRA